jgi:hypothetical protein
MDETDYVERAVVLFVKVIVGLENVTMASGLHGQPLLLHFCVSAPVSEFENLMGGVMVQRGQVRQAYLDGKPLCAQVTI